MTLARACCCQQAGCWQCQPLSGYLLSGLGRATSFAAAHVSCWCWQCGVPWSLPIGQFGSPACTAVHHLHLFQACCTIVACLHFLYQTCMLQVGVHGAGLTYHNFQRPGSALIEVFPCGFHQVGLGGLMVAGSHCSGPWAASSCRPACWPTAACLEAAKSAVPLGTSLPIRCRKCPRIASTLASQVPSPPAYCN